MLQVGTKAPDFTLPDQSGKPVSLGDFLGEKVVVLYFYPKDNTRGCTTEACTFRDSYESFTDAGAEVIGVSSDSVATHEQFAGAHGLPFVLLADTDKAVRKQYGATSLGGVMPGRVTFVIDREGVIRHAFSSQMNIGGHIEDALKVVKQLQ
ncbi:peroxiredoxin [Actinacidiphila alni]|nr:peroxiredoxin [Actinacidiphila alni]